MQHFRLPLALAVCVVAGVSWWLAAREPATKVRSSTPEDLREVDYRLTGVAVVRMTEAGRPAHRLRAATLRHFTDDDTTELDAPQLTVFQDTAPPWEVDAERAWMSADGSLILLEGEVVIERAGDDTRPHTRILTRDLRVQPRQDYAETDEPVRVETDVDRLDAVGMQAWLRPPSRLKFLSEVKGFYVPR